MIAPQEIEDIRQHVDKLEAKNPTVLWLAMRVPIGILTQLEILGIFDSEKKANEACKHDYDCVGPIELNKILPDTLWPGAYYPNLEDSPTVLPSSRNQLNRERKESKKNNGRTHSKRNAPTIR